MNLFYR